jgi:cobalt-precorrin 5A hydrolase/precorrin-3B C17-methyltransferase
MMRPAIVIRKSIRKLPWIEEVARALDGDIYGPPSEPFGTSLGLVPSLQQFFKDGRPLVAVMASAIVIRALAPFLSDKRGEPPVISVSVDGSSVVPLLGHHRGGNSLARKIAAVTGGHAAVSTATDLVFGVALDEPPSGYLLWNYQDYKAFAGAMLEGQPVRLTGAANWLSSLPQSPDAKLEIVVTEKTDDGSPQRLVFHPETLAVGLGCERGTSKEEIWNAVDQVFAANGLSTTSIAVSATIDLKEDEEGLRYVLGEQRLFTADELRAQSHRIRNPSETVLREVGTPSVAEAAALAAAGPDADLIVEKTKSGRVTVAVARSPTPILDYRGRQRGWISIVGIGPGNKDMRSPEADQELWAATDFVGYSLYLDLVNDVRHEQELHPFPLGEEEARVRHAIELAKQGKRVALICSGDAGIYAMASLVYEIIEREPCGIAVEVIPGISAFQAAAAKAGAMIGHDFCCISLSDLLTPWETIEKRVRAAAMGDFVVAFYNPRSAKRRDQLERAMAILGPERPKDTPVVIASNLGREGEKVRIVPLAEFDANEVDMLTIVLVGSSQSKAFKRGDGRTYAYTPRGYAQKRVGA